MEIICRNCKSKFKIADEKLPPGRTVSIKCSKCENKIELDTQASASTGGGGEAAKTEEGRGAYKASEKPFDYLEEGIETALLCEHDLEVKQKMRTVFEAMEYHVVEAASARNALKYLRFHVYNLVMVNEAFEAEGADSNHVLQYLSQLPISVRRNIFVVLLCKEFRTMDNMMAFNKSVNLVVNLRDVDNMGKLLKGALVEHTAFYQVFKESLKKTGRA